MVVHRAGVIPIAVFVSRLISFLVEYDRNCDPLKGPLVAWLTLR